MQLKHTFRATLASITLGGIIVSTPAYAASINYFSSAKSFTEETIYSPEFSWNRVGEQQVQVDGSVASASNSVSNDFGTRSGSATADLANGTLKAYSYAGSNNANGSVNQYSVAILADSFSITDPSGGPFSWASGDVVNFDFDVSGSSYSTPNTNTSVWLRLFVFAPGTFNYEPDSVEVTNGQADLSQALLQFSWGLTPDTTTDIDFKTYENIDIETVVDGQRVGVGFNLGGDFDWMLMLATSINIPAGDPYAYAELDFSHTIDVSYQGPTGSTTYSASGIFPGTERLVTNAVPEPETYALLLAGLGLVGWAARRRKMA